MDLHELSSRDRQEALEITRSWATARDNVVNSNRVTASLQRSGFAMARPSNRFMIEFTRVMDEHTANMVTWLEKHYGMSGVRTVAQSWRMHGIAGTLLKGELRRAAGFTSFDDESLNELMMNVEKILDMNEASDAPTEA